MSTRKSPEIEEVLRETKYYFYNKQYLPAIDRLNELLEVYPLEEDTAWLIRERASYHLLLRQNENAREDLLYIVKHLPTEVSDYFFLADTLVKQAAYKAAITFLDQGITESIDRNEDYYHDSLHFLKAFALLRIRQFTEARDALQRINSADKFWVDRPCEPYTKAELLMRIEEAEHYQK